MDTVTDTEISLHDAAEALHVHYMTAYRYVRLGFLPAHKAAGVWKVRIADLETFRNSVKSREPHHPEESLKKSAPWSQRMEARLLAGDATGAWGVVEAALVAGVSLDEIYTDVMSPALVSIGEQWARGDLEIYFEHRASAIVSRIMGRLGPRFTGRGRTRGSVLVGAPAGEHHALPVSMVSDLIRQGGWEVYDLGADLPAESFAEAAKNTDHLSAVCVSVTSTTALETAALAVAALREVVSPEVQIFVGGAAVHSLDEAIALGANGWASDVRSLLEMLAPAAA
jgi:methanogenic corrinoid protein MtbC1